MTDAHTPGPWKDVPAQYQGRWIYDVLAAGGAFAVHCNGFVICEAEDSEVAHAICLAHNGAPTLAAEVSALKARVSSLEAENGELKKAMIPDLFWPADDPENGLDTLDALVDDIGNNSGERRLQFLVDRAARVSSVWVVAHTDDNDMWVISEHETEADADAAFSRIGGRAG